MCAHSQANEKWKSQLLDFEQSNSDRELFGIDGQPSEVEWNIFPGRTSLEIFQKIDTNLDDRQINPEHFEGRIIFMSMFYDIDGTKIRNSLDRISTSKEVRDYAKRFQRWHWSFLSPGQEDEWCGLYTYKTDVRLRGSCWVTLLLFSADLICAIPCSLSFAIKKQKENVTKMPILWLNTLKKVDTIYSEVSVAFNRGILKQRRKIYDSLFCGIFECKAITSHNPLGKSAQYARSSIEFVWRLRWKGFWSDIFACGQIYFKRERSAIVKVEPARSGFFVKRRGSDLAGPCYPHDNIVGSHLCDECMKSILLIACFVSSCPFRDCSSKFVQCSKNVRSTNSCQVQAFQDNLWAYIWHFSNWFNFFLLEVVIIQARSWDFVQLFCLFIRQFTISFNALFRMTFHIVRPRDSFCVRRLQPSNFSVALAENRDSNIFVYCSIMISFGLHSRWVHPKHTWSRSISASLHPYFAFFQPCWCHPRFPTRTILVSDVQKDIPNSLLFYIQVLAERRM